MKILIVEDDPVSRLLVEGSVQSLGYETVSVENGGRALEAFEREPFRLVVCDWIMPKMDGLELCRRVRQLQTDYVYFILLTQMPASPENEDAAIAAGVDDFLLKPVDRRELKTRLHVASRILAYSARIQMLESFIPICSYCKKVRDDHNYWQQIEKYINQRTGSAFSHSVCPDCYETQIVPQLVAMNVKPPPYARRTTQPS